MALDAVEVEVAGEAVKGEVEVEIKEEVVLEERRWVVVVVGACCGGSVTTGGAPSVPVHSPTTSSSPPRAPLLPSSFPLLVDPRPAPLGSFAFVLSRPGGAICLCLPHAVTAVVLPPPPSTLHLRHRSFLNHPPPQRRVLPAAPPPRVRSLASTALLSPSSLQASTPRAHCLRMPDPQPEEAQDRLRRGHLRNAACSGHCVSLLSPAPPEQLEVAAAGVASAG
ncbi:hypothetical protein FB451DRAFT_1409557 [Mycena latifolia]|nr:hypothetical protein FB451DRAFT_1409557 [Mycena latifolia]